MNNRKGISLTELVISTFVLSIVMLGTAGFTINYMDASFRNSKQLMNVNQVRSVCESMASEISNAAYIYPADKEISLTSGEFTISINTGNAVALLYEDNTGTYYGFTAFFLRDDGESVNLYQFTESPCYIWDDNTSPAASLLSFYGNVSVIAEDIDTENTSLSYILNYTNGLTDEILLGGISSVSTSDENALIKGIDWKIAQSNIGDQTVQIKELSRKVPRFYEQ